MNKNAVNSAAATVIAWLSVITLVFTGFALIAFLIYGPRLALDILGGTYFCYGVMVMTSLLVAAIMKSGSHK